MPIALCDATIQPIPKCSKDPTISAILSWNCPRIPLGKDVKWSILTTWSNYFTASDLQFGFKSVISTIMCTSVIKNRYLNKGSKVYACQWAYTPAFERDNVATVGFDQDVSAANAFVS